MPVASISVAPVAARFGPISTIFPSLIATASTGLRGQSGQPVPSPRLRDCARERGGGPTHHRRQTAVRACRLQCGHSESRCPSPSAVSTSPSAPNAQRRRLRHPTLVHTHARAQTHALQARTAAGRTRARSMEIVVIGELIPRCVSGGPAAVWPGQLTVRHSERRFRRQPVARGGLPRCCADSAAS